MRSNSRTLMPIIFFGHGSPMNTLSRNKYTEAWRALGAAVPRPKAILAISAHWFTRGTAVTAMAKPRTIHDFGGFPQALLRHAVPGARRTGTGGARARPARAAAGGDWTSPGAWTTAPGRCWSTHFPMRTCP